MAGGRPARVAGHVDLGLAQGGGRVQLLLDHVAIEPLHQDGGGPVVDAPQAGQHAGSPGVHEAAGQADETFAPDLLAEGGLAGGEDDQVRVELQIVDVVQPQESI